MTIRDRLSRFGAALGNWNDRHHYDSRGMTPWHNRMIDRFAGWLYVLADGQEDADA